MFILDLIFNFFVPKAMYVLAKHLPRKPKNLVSEERRQNKGRGLVPAAPCNFIARRPKAALLFWFFDGFRYVWLFIVFLFFFCLI